VNETERQRRRRPNYEGQGYASEDNSVAIKAYLVAAIVPKPLVVTGWALSQEEAERPEGGAKSTHLAVPAGAVYYFEAETERDAIALAAALNWHGDAQSAIRNPQSSKTAAAR
jgi:hypothetical protein